MRLLVCGGRDYKDRDKVFARLDEIENREGLLIIEGGQTGADRLARKWCIERNVPFVTDQADWKKHGRAAGPIRNQHMLDYWKPDKVLAFPGGTGTANMVGLARKAGVEVEIVK